MNNFAKFLENNRQLGSTTRLVELTIGKDGYLVVLNHSMKKCVLTNFPRLLPERVLTMTEIKNGHWPQESRPVFVDSTALIFVE
jgi:hypothetical protein